MLKKTRLSLAVGAAFSAGLVGFAPSALGQTAPVQPVSGQQLDRVEITGSLIRRSQSETCAAGYDDQRRVNSRKAGVTTAEQAMSFIAENQSAVNTTALGRRQQRRGVVRDLRGLGPTRTLVLLNGQRVVNNPVSGRRGRPEYDPDRGDRAHRSAARRRVGHLRHRRHRRRGQHHHAQGIRGHHRCRVRALGRRKRRRAATRLNILGRLRLTGQAGLERLWRIHATRSRKN